MTRVRFLLLLPMIVLSSGFFFFIARFVRVEAAVSSEDVPQRKNDIEILCDMVDDELIPKLLLVSKQLPTFTSPQVMYVEASPNLTSLAQNLLASLKRLSMDNMLFIATTKERGCRSFVGGSHGCGSINALLTVSKRLTHDAKPDGHQMLSLLLLRIVVIWRATLSGIGIMLLDADVAFFRNMYTIPELSKYDMVFSVNMGNGVSHTHCFPPYLSPPGRYASTPIPPWINQPSTASYWERVALQFEKYNRPDVSGICDEFKKIFGLPTERIVRGTILRQNPFISHEFVSHDMKAASLRCRVSQTECDPWPDECWNKEVFSSRFSYHANCAREDNDPKIKRLELIRRGAWFLIAENKTE